MAVISVPATSPTAVLNKLDVKVSRCPTPQLLLLANYTASLYCFVRSLFF